MKKRDIYSHGGIMATGEESLMQMDFITELFEEAARRGILKAIRAACTK